MSSDFKASLDLLNVLAARRDLTSSIADSRERLASGLRINSAKDDPGGLAEATSLKSDAAVFDIGASNAADALAAVSHASDATSALYDIVYKIKVLSAVAANDVTSSTQRAALNTEAQALVTQYNDIVGNTTYNARKLIDGTAPALVVQGGFSSYSLTTPDLTQDFTETVTQTTINTTTTITGPGTFQNFAPEVTVMTKPDSVALADFNSDGYLDSVVGDGSNTGGGLILALGNGNGSFKSGSTFVASLQGVDVTTGDVNGDGNQDIIATGKYTDALNVLLGNGNGTFKAAISTVALDSFDVVAGDINGDSIVDISYASGAPTNTVNVQLGNGNGTFKTAQTFAGADRNPIFADVNGDTYKDLIYTNDTGNFSISLANSNGTFKAATAFTSDAATRFVKTGDFNGDNNIDIITGGIGRSDVLVFLGNGNSTFQAATSYATPVLGSNSDIGVGDYNGDGSSDFIVSSDTSRTAYAYVGNGNGTFQSATTFEVGSNVYDFATGDINNDGIDDVAAAWFNSGSLTVSLGDAQHGIGTFQAAVSYSLSTTTAAAAGDGTVTEEIVISTPNKSLNVATGDFNGDGNLDAVTIGSNAAFLINLGNGNGSFSAPVCVAALSNFSNYAQLRIGDLNGDGFSDLVASTPDTDSIRVVIGNGNGTFKSVVSYDLPSPIATSEAVELGDFTGDGVLDVVSSDSGGAIYLLANNGNGTFKANVSFNNFVATNYIASGDINGDNFRDIVNEGNILLGNGNGTFKTGTAYTPGSSRRSPVLVDFNADGVLDLAADTGGGSQFEVSIGNGNGTFKAVVSYATDRIGFNEYTLTAGDMNGDNIADIVVSEGFNNSIGVFINNGNGTFKARQNFSTVNVSDNTAIGDFNNDGAADIVAGSRTAPGFGLFLGTLSHDAGSLQAAVSYALPSGTGAVAGDGTFQEEVVSAILHTSRIVINADVNSDGKLDVLSAGTADKLSVSLGNGNGTFQSANEYDGAGGFAYYVDISASDVNSDGISDVVAVGSLNDTVQVFLGNGNGSFKTVVSYAVASAGLTEDIEIGDFNGDGVSDIVTNDFGTAAHLLVGNGNGTFQASTSTAFAAAFESISSGDINADGFLDIVSSDKVLLGNGNGTFKAGSNITLTGGTKSTRLVDLNGDNQLDIVAGSNGGSSLAVAFGNGNGTFKASASYTLGVLANNEFQVSTGDINGDGYSDLVSAEYGSSTISVLLNNGNGTFKARYSYATTHGSTSTTIGDFNGDGAKDIVDGRWAVAEFGFLAGNIAHDAGTFKAAVSYTLAAASASVGDGTFAASVSVGDATTAPSPVSIVHADFNQDGFEDIAMGDGPDGGGIQIILNNGNGTFKAASVYNTGLKGVTLAVRGSSDIYLFAIGKDSDAIVSMHGNGDGTFQAPLSYATGSQPVSITEDDIGLAVSTQAGADIEYFDFMGNPVGTLLSGVTAMSIASGATRAQSASKDIIFSTGSNSVGILLANGNGSFEAPTYISSDNNTNLVAAGRFDTDNNADILSAGVGQNNVLLTVSNGNGTFKSAVSIGTPFAIGANSHIEVGDYNYDGFSDFILSSDQSSSAAVFLGNGNASFKAAGTFSVGTSTYGFTVADFTHDSGFDVASVSQSDGLVHLAQGNTATPNGADGSGVFIAPQIIDPNFSTNDGDTLTGDVNGDGIQDIVVTHRYDPAISVFLSNGNGSFKASVSFSTSIQISYNSAKLLDINGDSNLDFIGSGDDVTVVLGNGNGTFQTAVTYTSGPSIYTTSIDLSDYNSDGNADLLVEHYDVEAGILFGNGNGTFQAYNQFLAQPAPFSRFHEMIGGDLNGDGNRDIVFTRYNVAGGQILLGNGNGTFSIGDYIPTTGSYDPIDPTYALSTNPNLIDLNNDGFLDFVTDSSNFDQGNLFVNGDSDVTSVALGNGNGTFKAYQDYEIGANGLGRIALGDLNGDGYSDILASSYGIFGSSPPNAKVLINNGNGTFKQAINAYSESEVGFGYSSLTLGDFNADGILDATSFGNTNGPTVMFGTNALGNGSFQSSVSIATAKAAPYSIVNSDFNSDGYQDFAVSDGSPGGSGIKILLNNGNGSYKSPVAYAPDIQDGILAVGDFNSDSISDIVVAGNYSERLNIFYGNGNGSFKSAQTLYSGWVSGLSVGDVNGDGKDDIGFSNNYGLYNYNSYVIFGNGNGTFGDSQFSMSFAQFTLNISDVNGDSLDDLVGGSDSNSINVVLSLGNGTFDAELSFAADADTRFISVADFNGDSQLDILSGGVGASNVLLSLGNGNGTFQAGTSFATPFALTDKTQLKAGDYNYDGLSDFIVSSDQSATAAVFLGNGNASFKASTSFAVAADAYGFVAADLNNDSGIDVASISHSTGLVYVAQGNLGAGGSTVTSPTEVINADFNNDGTLDLAIASSVDNVLDVHLGNGNGTFKAGTSFATDATTKYATSTDANGDGFVDIVTGDTTSGNISVLLGNGNGSFKAKVSYNVGSNIVSVTSYDLTGDGAQDLIVGDASVTGTFKVLVGNGNGTYKAGVSYGVGGNYGVSLADVDGDGKIDVISANHDIGAGDLSGIMVTLGNGNGTFKATSSSYFATGLGPTQTKVADFNGDGKLDIAASSATDGKIDILLGNGNGSFQARVSYAAGTTPQDLSVGDFNADGIQDLATADLAGKSVSMFLGNGNGSFKAPTTYTGLGSTNGSSFITTGDFNRDGGTDIAVTQTSDNTFAVLLGNTTANSGATTAADPQEVINADFNQDGILDLAIASDTLNILDVHLGNGNGTFKAGTSYATDATTKYATAVDTNRDGIVDIVTADTTSGNISILIGNGNGSFKAKVSYNVGSNIVSVASMDVDADTIVDLVVGDASGTGTFKVLLGNGNGTYQAGISYGSTGNFGITLADVNGDNFTDVVSANHDLGAGAQSGVMVALGNSNGSFKAAVTYATGTGPTQTQVADFNGDGKSDIAVSSANDGKIDILLGNGNGTFQARTSYSAGVTPQDLSKGDFNADGYIDLATADLAGKSVSIFFGNGNGSFKAPATFTNVGSSSGSSFITTGDFNRDGGTDIAVTQSGDNTYTVLLGNTTSNGGGAAAVTNPQEAINADFNNDGYFDIALTSSDNNLVEVHLGNGNGTFKAGSTFATDTNVKYATSIDTNADGYVDIITADTSSGVVSVLLGNGNGSFKAKASYSAGTNVVSVVAADVNADGQADLITGDASGTGTFRVLVGNGNGTYKASVSYGSGGNYGISIADVNADGIADVVSANHDLGAGALSGVMVSLGNGNGTFKVGVTYVTGTGPVQTQVADFNGDGKADIVTVDSTDGKFDLLLGNGNGTFQARTSFSAGTTPQDIFAGDFNADGKKDVATIDSTGKSLSVFLGNGNGTFQAATTYTGLGSTGGPNYISAGDFNRDGGTDFLVTESTDNKFSILLSNVTDSSVTTSSTTSNTYAATVDLSTQIGAANSYVVAASALLNVSVGIGTVSGNVYRLESAVDLLGQARDTVRNAAKHIMNADIAAEKAKYMRELIIRDSNTAIIAQANLSAERVYSLLEGSGIIDGQTGAADGSTNFDKLKQRLAKKYQSVF